MNPRLYVRQGNFDNFCPAKKDRTLQQTVTYVSTAANAKISSFDCNGYPDGIAVLVEFANERLTQEDISKNMNDFKAILPAALRNKYWVQNTVTRLSWLITNNELLKHLILCIHQFSPFDELSKKEIMRSLKLTPIIALNDVIETLEKDGIEKALAYAIESDNQDIIYQLGKFCQAKYPDNLQMAVDCYQEIDNTNPHFNQSNQEMLTILMENEVIADNQDKRIGRLEKLFYCSLNSGDVNVRLTSLFFHELCGHTDLNPKIAEVKGDYETLINLAGQLRELNSMNAALRKDKKSATIPASVNESPSEINAKKKSQSADSINSSRLFGSEGTAPASPHVDTHKKKI